MFDIKRKLSYRKYILKTLHENWHFDYCIYRKQQKCLALIFEKGLKLLKLHL